MNVKLLAGIFLASALILSPLKGISSEATAPESEAFYPQTFIVTEVAESGESQLVTIETVTGFLYQFESDAGDWTPGDLCACIMNDNGTPEITDDIVIDARYSGITEWFVEIYPN